MSSKELIYVKFDYPEALESKRGILSVQKSLMDVAERVRKHHELRIRELKLKAKILARMKGTINALKRLKKVLPLARIPKILKHEIEGKTEMPELKVKKISGSGDIESQLKEIQEKLKRLQR